jgi:hypothetical protein
MAFISGFLKMSTEVEEFGVLKVAKEIIMSFKPKLAITVYHSLKDFWEIPEWLDSLGLGYKFYLRHFTIHSEETVLFAEI